ncbi:MAG TPA: AAA domain-containing protein [Bacteroidia bacterium]|nr:AAA domain-containing protein [Bacteroidia bacterium]
MNSDPKEELRRFVELLSTEKDEDYRQYIAQFERCSITERRKNGVTWYPVRILSEEMGAGDYISIEVERTQGMKELHQFGGGKMVEIFSNTGDNGSETWKISGTIRNVWGDRMRISFMTDELPGWTERGKLGLNLLFDENSYREMLIALQKVIDAGDDRESRRLAKLRDVFYGLEKAEFEKEDTNLVLPGLNKSQNEAVRHIIAAKEVALVHGPPGTGKTTTFIQAIRHTLMHEKQVLVCSPSNIAVDLLTEKLVQQGINVLRLGNPARVSEEVLNNTLDAKMIAHPNYKELKEYRKRSEEFFAMAKKYKRNFGHAEREQRNLLYNEARQLVKEATALEDYIFWEQFGNAQVIACTPVVSAGKMLRDKKFRTVFIDEAGQALEPMSWIPITKAERVIFAGDHLQLPPTVKSKKAEDGGLKFTLFERLMRTQPHASVILRTQYRMNEKIMQFSNRMFYGNKLEADVSVKDNVLSFDGEDDLLNRPVDFIDTAGCGFSEEQNPESLSYSNPEEANLLLRYLERVLDQYEKMPDDSLRIGIIAPYRQQTEWLAQQLEEREWKKNSRHAFSVRTVDGFQGQERDIIAISLTRSNDNGEIGFLADTRRMNVALTRAKKKLIIIGDSATLANHSFYKSFLDYVEEIGAYRSAWEMME